MYENLLALTEQVRQVGFFLWTWVFGAIIIIAGFYFTIRTGFAQFTLLKDVGRIITGKDKKQSEKTKKGKDKPETSLSAFQAFAISEASRVGTGNIVGVGVAIVTGGAGAIFWMWAMALISAATNLVESTLAQVYKENHGDRFMGGPMFYFQKAFKSKKPAYLFAVLLAVLYVFIWNSVQTNTIVDTFVPYVPGRIYIGLILAAVVSLIIFGGMKRITQVTSTVLPVMVIIFLVVGTGIILFNLPAFFQAFTHIIRSAFGARQAAGGVIGFTLGQALQQGLRRGIFSNEAGIGSKPIAAATSDVTHPVKQGIVYSFGVYVDTLWISSVTAFIVLMSPHYGAGETGVLLVRNAIIHFTGALGTPFFYAMFLLLPFTSVIGNYFYGESCLRFVTKNKTSIMIFRFLAIILIIFASLVPLQLVWNIADIFTGTLATLNIFVLFKLSKVAIAVLKDYTSQRAQYKKDGTEPVFVDKNIGIETAYWNDAK